MNNQNSLTHLLAGLIKPGSIVGSGYKNPRQVASEWLRKEIHNDSCNNDASCRVDQIHGTSSGKAFTSEARAMKSNTYKQLVNGVYKTFSGRQVKDFGVMPSPHGDGYEIYVSMA